MENDKNLFNNNLNSTLHVKTNYNSKSLNYTWVEIFEETIPYLDNLLRNPKRFIVNEEEVVKIEKAKKVTVEAVIHLTQHTNLIENIDPETNEVRPAKLLNINKEESLDTYENRFVHTLIKNMRIFYDRHSANLSGNSYLIDEKNAEYDAETVLGTERVKISLKYSSLNKDIKKDEITLENGQSDTLENRLKLIKVRLDGFMREDLMVVLNKLHVPDVTSPIKKTNAILKNPNFQKATQLWNFIQSYNQDDAKEENIKKDYLDSGEIRNEFDSSFYLNYMAMNNNSKKQSKKTNKMIISNAIFKVIENILDMDDQILETKLKMCFKEEYENAKKNHDEKMRKIINIFKDKLELDNNKIKNSLLELE